MTDSLPSLQVLLVGASRGIGREVARDLAAAGHRLWLAASSTTIREAAQHVAHDSRASRVDVADPQSVAALFNEVQREWHGLDAVIHTAAELGQAGNFWQLDDTRFART